MAGNILAVLVLFAKSANIFLRQKIALYGIYISRPELPPEYKEMKGEDGDSDTMEVESQANGLGQYMYMSCIHGNICVCIMPLFVLCVYMHACMCVYMCGLCTCVCRPCVYSK